MSEAEFIECVHRMLIYDSFKGETVCNNCGTVLNRQRLDQRPEWRAFATEKRTSASRVGKPLPYPVTGEDLRTKIGFIDRDASGKKLPFSAKQQMQRLKKWQDRYATEERNMARARAELNRLADKTHLPQSIKEEATFIYRKALRRGLIRGRCIVCVVAAALYAACRESGTPRTLREIAKASLVSKKEVARCYRLLLEKLELPTQRADPIVYLSKIAYITRVSGVTQGLATRILKEYRQKNGVAGKDPASLVAAALYLAGVQNHERKTQKDFAKAAGVTEVTVRNHTRSIKRRTRD